MYFLAEAPQLGVQVLELVVVAGRPVRGRGGGVEALAKRDFETLVPGVGLAEC